MPSPSTWQRYVKYRCALAKPSLEIDISRIPFTEADLKRMAGPMKQAFAAMAALEAGAIANPTEGRMVGHYWLRNPALARQAPGGAAIARQITNARSGINAFARKVRKQFTDILLIGIGGSALGPQFIADALGPSPHGIRIHFFDNTDPDGLRRTLDALRPRLKTTLTIVISKSGGTPETHNGMIAAQQAYKRARVDFAARAVAVTGVGSKLDRHAAEENWLARFPMWDWVGGRTSVMGPVGLLPMALLGFDTNAFLNGAADCDAATRVANMRRNPAALLALMWHYATNGRGEKDMVVLPYRDRLQLFSRYLQQLVMESLGKRTTADGKRVLRHPQGIAVYGNKGSTDQHAYVQQLRDGVNNFFATFIESLEDDGADVRLDTKRNGETAGDYLGGFLVGTRRALWEGGRQSITITVPRVDAYHIGALIALYERAVGFYATLVGINAYDQPGVAAGKKAADAVLRLQRMVFDLLAAAPRAGLTVEQIRRQVRYADDVPKAERVPKNELAETIWRVARRLAANGRLTHRPGKTITQDRFARKTTRR